MKHWANTTGNKAPTYCTVVGCIEKDPVGAHVLKAHSTDKSIYIAPLCTKHNNGTETMDIGVTKLASSNKANTCDS